MIRIKKLRKLKNQNQRRSPNEIFNNNALGNIPYPYWMEWDRRMKRIIRNLTTVSPSYDGQAKGSCSVWLNGTDQSVPVPITSDVSCVTWMSPIDGTYKTLPPSLSLYPNELIDVTSRGTSGFVDNGDGSYDIPNCATNKGANINCNEIENPVLTFNASNITGEVVIKYWTTSWQVTAIVNGVNRVEAVTPEVQFTIDSPTAGGCTISDVVVQVGNQVPTLPPSSTTYNLTESWQNLLVTSVAVTDTDREVMTNNPEALVNMVLTSVDNGNLSFGVADIEHFYLGNEGVGGGAHVQDLMTPPEADMVDASFYVGGGTKNTTIIDETINFTGATSDCYYYKNLTPPVLGECYIVGFTISDYEYGQVFVDLDGSDANGNGGSRTPIVTTGNGNYMFCVPIVTEVGGTTRPIIRNGTVTTLLTLSNLSIRKVSTLEIVNYTEACRTTYLNTQVGTSNLALIRDASGRPTAPVDDNTLAFSASGENVDTKFKPNLNVYTINEVVSGLLADLDSSGDPLGTFSQRTEYRVLKHDKDGSDSYYIDNILQGYVPPLPDPDTVIKLNNIAAIGYSDERDLTNCQFKVYTEILTPEEGTADYDDYVACRDA